MKDHFNMKKGGWGISNLGFPDLVQQVISELIKL